MKVRIGMSVLQDWVMQLPLRHQGVLVASIRGCDTAQRHDSSKRLARAMRGAILNAAVDEPTSFIDFVEEATLRERMELFLNDWDHYPHHYNMHVVHAAAIIGYHGPDDDELNWMVHGRVWCEFYFAACKKLHVNPETKAQLHERLCADEDAFSAAQDVRLDGAK